ncbi:flagellar biosynthesis protein FlhB [Tabrizicola sp.]|uniref:EscU/YscU/HrcU family type III secretion system export apparatus switch protein n=1 Tax=Tabrizicola sp. TaxID=2005166 RepID=UPI00261F6928|nr:flagellar type III secretion system protein FlhB [Tabrizicola sp.]MDM7931820.1 flagellar type III secretion system protein FlhB [Tabrizicola sp.]
MSGEDDDNTDKEHEASPQKLIESRKKGDIARSADLLMAAGIAGLVLGLVAMGGWVVERAGTAGAVLLDQSDSLARLMATGSSGPLGGILLAFAGPPLALLLMPMVVVVGMIVVTRGFVVAPERVAPKLSRISPVATAKHKFGPEGLMEFAKSAAKLGLVSTLLYLFLASRLEDILATIYLTPALSTAVLARLTLEFLFILLLLAAALGGIDFLWQIHLHRQRNRMSRKELMDEYKQSEGDPHLKSTRRQRAQEVATNRMLADVATADVVVVNPTHYAVALRWDRAKGGAPVCVAKGVDEIARVIRARAAENGIPLHSDPPTARAIFATVDLGQEVRAEHYRAVAAAIRFADAMRRKAQRS